MLILDLSQILYSTILVGLKHTPTIEEDYLRHLALNTIRAHNQKFKNQFGKLVIATDGSNSWRKEIFPYYKANRKKTREASILDWPKIFQIMALLREELKEFFPYPIIHFDTAEADDIIGVLAKHFSSKNQDTLIISSDKDFKQLHGKNIYQYDPIHKVKVNTDSPSLYLKEHIIRGDPGDGIPNILSKDSVFVSGQRQNRLTKQRFTALMNMEPNEYDPEHFRNYRRNEQLIDLNNTPTALASDVLDDYYSQQSKDSKKMFKYFMDKKLRNLMSSISDF